jgi:membrane protease YdiL (CAAX protease family)
MPRVKRSKKQSPAEPKGDRTGRLLRDPQTKRPLPSLIFLLPFLAFYGVGVFFVRPDFAARADILVRQVIAPLGVTGIMVPTYLVVAVLLIWHVLRRDPTRLSWPLLGLMAAETVLLMVPLFGIFGLSRLLLHEFLSLAIPAAPPASWMAVAMGSIGAGIYEELLFRLFLVGGPLLVARWVLKDQSAGLVAAVILVSAALFAGAHTIDNPRWFEWDSFLFRTAAGVYLGYVFAYRGFGIAAGVHILYDLIIKLGLAAR